MTRPASLLPKLALFAVSAVVSALVASVAVNAAGNPGPVSTAGTAPAYLLAGPATPSGSNAPVAFDEAPAGTPQPLPALTQAELQVAAQSMIGARPAAWVNPTGFPRVAPISQFDGGALQAYNCTLASGAMLARLASGIVTDGSTLRGLQDKQVGGTSLNNLSQALWHGYGVSYQYGLVSLPSLKALLRAGYGAVAQGVYGEVPVQLRLQADFTGGHAIYLDGYFPGDSTHGIPEAYYVIDPLGYPWAGYEGDWWPAAAVDQFLTAFSGGSRASAMWAYPPGGTPPAVVAPDVLPMPPDPPSGGPSPSESAAPSESGLPSASALPSESAPVTPSQTAPATPGPGGSGGPTQHWWYAGDLAVLAPVIKAVADASDGGVELLPLFDICVRVAKPAGCPIGLTATVKLRAATALQAPPGPAVTVQFVDSPTANMAIVGYTVDPATASDVRFWAVGGTPATVGSASAMTTALIGGQTVTLARLDVAASTQYQFQVVAGSGATAAVSPVGSFTTGAGVAQFDVAVGSAPSPSLGLGLGLSPYLHLPQSGLAPPIVPAAQSGPCSLTGPFDGVSYCLLPVVPPDMAACTRATVTYALSGLSSPGVIVRAYPRGGPGGIGGVLEASGPAPSGSLDVGCLASGLTYTVALYAQGDGAGVLAQRTISAP